MCGIVGVLGGHEVAPMLVEALRRLEYRGYDSAGIATLQDGVLDRRRAVGKLVNLSDHLVHNPLAGKAGIGHTRWATHGAPSETNAHPHRAGSVAVVHNGIIENYKDLRADLAKSGITPQTETDTETVALLAQQFLASGKTPVEAAMATIEQLDGAFALCFLFEGHDDLLVAARKGSPLAIGHGDGEMYVGSDAIALAPMTNRITYLDEGDRAVVTRAGVEIFDETGAAVTREMRELQVDAARVDKGGYKHFMAKEIAEQPQVLSSALQAYLTEEGIALPEPGIDFTKIDRLVMVACGTAYYACFTAKYWFEKIAGIPVEVDVASEFRYREPPIMPGTSALFVSQSGETADTLAALRAMPGLFNAALDRDADIAATAKKISEARDILFLGRGLMYPLALEGALKLKEISYIHAEAYASGELKHGPIALVDKHVPIVVLAPRDSLFEKTISNMQEVMARGGKVCLITDEAGVKEAGADVWRTITMPAVPEVLSPLLYAIPAQLLAYHTAIAKGTDVDQPRNLAKSVTVE